MPLYIFESNGRIEEFFYKMNDVPSVGVEITDENGVKWKRLFTKPNASVTTRADPYSVKDFHKRLDGKNATIGDLWDASAEASDKRASKEGVDPIKKKYLDEYKKTRNGQSHNVEKKEKFESMQKDLGISIDLKSLSGR